MKQHVEKKDEAEVSLTLQSQLIPSTRSGRSQDSSKDPLFKLISITSLEESSEEEEVDSLEDTPIETTIFLGFFFTIVC